MSDFFILKLLLIRNWKLRRRIEELFSSLDSSHIFVTRIEKYLKGFDILIMKYRMIFFVVLVFIERNCEEKKNINRKEKRGI